MKICKKCGEGKNIEEFSIHKNFKDGRNSKCKACKSIQAKEHYKIKMQDPEYNKKNKARWKHNRSWFTLKYGITKEEYQAAYEAQNGKCFICGEFQEVLCQDHCHKTNLNRRLLCSGCNLGLGHFRENIETLLKAIEYVKMYEVQP